MTDETKNATTNNGGKTWIAGNLSKPPRRLRAGVNVPQSRNWCGENRGKFRRARRLLGCGRTPANGRPSKHSWIQAAPPSVALADMFQDQPTKARAHFDEIQKAKGFFPLWEPVSKLFPLAPSLRTNRRFEGK